MKKIVIILILSCGFLASYSQTLRINAFLRDSVISPGQRALFFDSTHTGQWKNISQQAGGGSGSGTVQLLTGTANRITITGTPTINPIINIASTYVGQTSITTLGTITTGTWNGTAIANANLANSSLTIGSTSISLGATSTTLAGLTSVTSTAFTGALTGNASTATALATGRTISISGDLTYTSPSFDGTGNVSATGTLATVNSNVGTFGSATQSTQFTVNGKGLITAVSNVTITPAIGSITGFGTGVATALAVNVGSAGAIVVNGGALGTPSSGTLTNATGLPATTGIVGWPANSAGVLTNDGAGALTWGAAGSGDYDLLGGNNVTGGTGNFGAITSGTNNFALGNNALTGVTSGSRNIALGLIQAPRLTTASDIISLGYNNFLNVTTSLNSMAGIAIGSNNNGYHRYKNLAIGVNNNGQNVDSSDAVNAIAADNISIGVENLFNLRSGLDNTAVGWGILEFLDSGSFNNAYGQYALGVLVTGSRNNAFGFRAGRRLNAGDRNIFIGDSSGRSTGATSMNNSIFIGANSRFTGTNLFNRITIGDSALNSQDNLFVAGRAGTFFAVGRPTATEQIHIDGAILIGERVATTDGTIDYSGGAFRFRQGGVDVALGGGSSAWNGITDPTGDQALSFGAGESSTWTDANTTEDLFTVNNATQTTGSMFSFNRTGTANAAGNNIMELISTGATATNAITNTGLNISVTNTNATSGTNKALVLTASGATTLNTALEVTAGRVGINESSPQTILQVGEDAGGVSSFGTVAQIYFTNSGGSTYITGRGSSSAEVYFGAETGKGVMGMFSNHPYEIRTNNTTRVTIAAAGDVTMTSLAGTGDRAVIADASGVLSAPVSDFSVKKNIQSLNYGIDELMKLRPVSFEFIDGWKNHGEGRQIGFIAQDVQRILPNSVFTTPSTGKMGYNSQDIIPVLVQAVQEQQEQIEQLKKELRKLKRR